EQARCGYSHQPGDTRPIDAAAAPPARVVVLPPITRLPCGRARAPSTGDCAPEKLTTGYGLSDPSAAVPVPMSHIGEILVHDDDLRAGGYGAKLHGHPRFRHFLECPVSMIRSARARFSRRPSNRRSPNFVSSPRVPVTSFL